MKTFFTTLLTLFVVSVVAQTHEPNNLKTHRLLKLQEAGYDLEAFKEIIQMDEPYKVFLENMENHDVDEIHLVPRQAEYLQGSPPNIDKNGADPMVLVFDTNLSDGRSIILPLFGTVNVTVSWGDGSHSAISSAGSIYHSYAQEGEYTVSINGTLDQFGEGLRYYSEARHLKKVLSFGNLGLNSLSGAFIGAINLIEVPSVLPSSITDLSYMFSVAYAFNQDIGGWNVSNVTNMSGMFEYAFSFNHYIGGWDVSNVTNMESMFSYASVFNQDIGGWNVSSVTNMHRMFMNALVFDQNIGDWDVSNVDNMAEMFLGASFNQDIGGWDVSNVTDMNFMFSFATSFNQDIGGWDVSNVTNMSGMFSGGYITHFQFNQFNQDIGGWDTGNVSNMAGMFYLAESFNQDIGGWDVSNVTNMSGMFRGANSFNQNIGGWDTGNVTNMEGLFAGTISFNQDIGGWDVSSVTNMSEMFRGATAFNHNIGGWNVSNVSDMGSMFLFAFSFNQNIGEWNVSSVMNMNFMFGGANSFNQDIGGWNVRNVKNMGYMFYESSRFNQDISGWDVSNVTYMESMFEFAMRFNQDLSGWCVFNISSISIFFDNGATSWTLPRPVWGTCPGRYMLSIEVVPSSAGEPIGWGFYSPDEEVLIYAVENPGWEFVNWTGDIDYVTDPNSSNTIVTMPPYDISLTANFMLIPDAMVLYFNTWANANRPITLPLFGAVNVTVDWGDGNHSEITSEGLIQHTYADRHFYTVSIIGILEQFGNGSTGYVAEGLAEVLSFGNLGLKSLSGAFYNAVNLNKVPSSLPSSVIDLSHVFRGASSFNQDIGGWDVSNVTNMNSLFQGALSFNQNIGGWNVSSVTDMSRMFRWTTFDQDIGGWDVHNVVNMSFLFEGSVLFNQDIGGWETGNVTNMRNMFYEAFAFNQDIGGWDTGKVTNMERMFLSASAFNQDIGKWDVSNVKNMWAMFSEASSFDQDLGRWDVRNVINFMEMFYNATSFNQDLSGWCVEDIPTSHPNFDTGASSWTLQRPVWGTCPQDEGVPENRPLSSRTIPNGETDCFDAQQTITVSDFTIQSGGTATLIAGQSITLLPGTVVEAGGLFHAYITTENIYCMGPLNKSMVAEEVIVSVPEIQQRIREDLFFKVYPNPTSGSFTLELENADSENDTYIEVINLLGKRLFNDRLPSQNLHTLSLEGQQPGIYIIRVTKGNTVGTERIIKR